MRTALEGRGYVKWRDRTKVRVRIIRKIHGTDSVKACRNPDNLV